jgi:D-arabinose 1-dehydrogenase-like Zn-dependent alcohol dehydrogenase
VHVEVRAIGLNFADIFACLGLYSATPQGAFVPGLECAGVVTAVGPGVTTWRIGDRVMVLTRFGGYATRLNARAESLWPIPAGWSFAQAAAYPVQALTAWYGLVPLGAARRDAVVLVQSAAGGVGLNALRALQALGARPVAVVGRAEKREFLMREFGLSPETVVLRDAALAKSLDAALAHLGAPGFDVVFDAVYGDAFRLAFDRRGECEEKRGIDDFGGKQRLQPRGRPETEFARCRLEDRVIASVGIAECERAGCKAGLFGRLGIESVEGERDRDLAHELSRPYFKPRRRSR